MLSPLTVELALRNGIFFITICTRKRMPLFADEPADPHQLSTEGEIAAQCWIEIPEHFPHIALDEFVIMPDHIHGIIAFIDRPAISVQSFKRPIHGSLQTVIGSYKSSVTRIVRARDEHAGKVWQQGFFDYRIRDIWDLRRIRNYIRDNPGKWSAGYRDHNELEEIQVWEG